MVTLRLLVNDTEAAIEFYVGQLEFELVENWGPFAIVAKEGFNVWLSGPQTSAARPTADGEQPVPGGWNRIAVSVPDLKATLEVLEQSGVKVRNRPIKGPGGKQALVEDGVGNLVELFEPQGE